MIICRSPLRITFGGGSTDLPEYANRLGGFCISAAINKYNYITINRTFKEEIILKYSELEKVKNPEEIKHPIFRESIKLLNFKTPQIEIVSVADVPATGSGLGSSGAFTVALLKALYSYRNLFITPVDLAEKACDINMNKLKQAQGKQDEYISSLGGLCCLEFNRDGSVIHYPLNIKYDIMLELEENLMLFYTGLGHSSNTILKEQENKTKENDRDMLLNLCETKELGHQSKTVLEKGDLTQFGSLLNAQWENKLKRISTSSNAFLEEIHNDLLLNGAVGSKLVGSGGGGFFLVYPENKNKVRQYMRKRNLEELRFSFDFEGAKRIL